MLEKHLSTIPYLHSNVQQIIVSLNFMHEFIS